MAGTSGDGRAAGPLRVAVVGPGAIGCAACAAVEQAGQAHVLLCGRTRADGRIVVERVGEAPYVLGSMIVTDPATVSGPVDVVILAVKAHQTASASPWLRTLCGPATLVAVFQNGVEHERRVGGLVGRASVLPVVVHCSAEMERPGRVVLRSPLRLVVPAVPDADLLARVLAPEVAALEPVVDFVTARWEKLCMNAAGGLMAATGRAAELYRSDGGAEFALRLAEECVAVGRAEGARLPDGLAAEIVERYRRLPPGSGSSILTDRLRGRPLEWDARNGVVQRLGRRHAIPTPASDELVSLLKALSGE